MEWLLRECVVLGVRDFQRKSGETVFQVGLAYMGGKVDLEVSPQQGQEFAKHVGQKCKAWGPLDVQVQQFGRNVETRVGYRFAGVEFAK